MERVAIKTLNDQYAPLIAKRLAGVVVKEIAADQVRQKNEGLGLLTFVGLHLTDRADLRQWSTLPETFQVAKIRLKAGKYKVKVQGYYKDEKGSNQTMQREFVIQPRRKTFFTWENLLIEIIGIRLREPYLVRSTHYNCC